MGMNKLAFKTETIYLVSVLHLILVVQNKALNKRKLSSKVTKK